MTEPHDFDELASAYLDGATSPEETARVEADPALQARVEELRAVRQTLGEVPPVDAGRRDAAIDAALAAFDEDALTAALRPATVTPIAARRGPSPGTLKALSVAAVVLLLVLVPLLLFDGGNDDEASFNETGAAISGDAEDSAQDGGTEAAEESADTTVTGPSSGGTESSPSALSAFGNYDDLDALATALATSIAEERGLDTAFSPADDTARCVADGPPGSVAGVATVAGEPVEVLVITSDDGARTLTVYDAASCEPVDERAL